MDEAKLHKLQQGVKWTVYTLLIVNFAFYFLEDLERARHILHSGSSFLDLTGEFATSIDESAWFILLFMFELETYVLEDEDWKGWVAHVIRGARLACYVMLAHTILAYSDTGVWAEWHAIREDVFLRVMEIIESSGTRLALPSQTTYFSRDDGLDDEKKRAAEEQVAEWTEKGELPFPNMTEEQREALIGTLEFPPTGSIEYKSLEQREDEKDKS